MTASKSGISQYSRPQRQRVSTTLLDRVHAQVKKDVDEVVKHDAFVTISSDFWTSRRQETVMNIMTTGRKGSVFIGEFFPKCIQSRDKDYIA